MRRRAFSARAVLFRHPWALGLLESRRNPGPATLRHHDWVIGCLRTAEFSVAATAQAFSTLDSYIHGFVLQESCLPFGTALELEDVADGITRRLPADRYPHLTEMFTDHTLRPGYAHADAFAPGPDLVINGLEGLIAGRAAP
ncbi:TetR/AcrR family transcriptional regulator C-terminal domain-containing protein [Streptomyces sp. QTS137]